MIQRRHRDLGGTGNVLFPGQGIGYISLFMQIY